MRRCFPIDMPRTLERLVSADAVEIVAQAAIVRFNFARDAGQKFLKTGLRLDGGIHHGLALQRDLRRFLQEAEGKRRRERKAVAPVSAAPWKANLDGLINRGAGRDQRKIYAGFQRRAARL